jgi:hypothetical protein
MSAVHLDEASIEAVASRVAEMLRGEDIAGEMTDAAGIARRFGVSRDWVYDHADELGAIRLGSGPRARLRLDPAKVEQCLSREKATTPKGQARRRRRNAKPGVDLLPIRGRQL